MQISLYIVKTGNLPTHNKILLRILFTDDPFGKATIWQIRDANVGLINIIGGTPKNPFKFLALFHIGQVFKYCR
jgi:hypothetical protein